MLRLAERLGTDLEPGWEICWGLRPQLGGCSTRSFVLFLLFDEHRGAVYQTLYALIYYIYIYYIHLRKRMTHGYNSNRILCQLPNMFDHTYHRWTHFFRSCSLEIHSRLGVYSGPTTIRRTEMVDGYHPGAGTLTRRLNL